MVTLCEACREKHSMDSDLLQHFHLPLIALQLIKSKQIKDQCKPWLYKLHTAYTILKSNEDEIMRFEEQLEATRKEVLIRFESEVNNQCTEMKHKLEQFRVDFAAELDIALKEVCLHALEQWTPEENSLASMMWNYDRESQLAIFRGRVDARQPKPAEVFQVTVETSLPSLAGFNLSTAASADIDTLRNEFAQARRRIESEKELLNAQNRELQAANLQLSDRLKELSEHSRNLGESPAQEIRILPLISANRLTRYNLRTGQSSLSPLSASFFPGTMLCFLSENSVLCVGGDNPASSRACILNLKDASLVEAEPMKTARGYPGFINHCSRAYVFGGFNNNPLSSCEKFASRDWSPLRNMQCGRHRFSPCSFQGLIYLPCCQVETDGAIETFDVRTEEFKTG